MEVVEERAEIRRGRVREEEGGEGGEGGEGEGDMVGEEE